MITGEQTKVMRAARRRAPAVRAGDRGARPPADQRAAGRRRGRARATGRSRGSSAACAPSPRCGCTRCARWRPASRCCCAWSRATARAGRSAEPMEGAVVEHNPCLSGGSLEIFLEPHLPAAALVIVGGSPIARALERLARAAGYDCSLGAGGRGGAAGRRRGRRRGLARQRRGGRAGGRAERRRALRGAGGQPQARPRSCAPSSTSRPSWPLSCTPPPGSTSAPARRTRSRSRSSPSWWPSSTPIPGARRRCRAPRPPRWRSMTPPVAGGRRRSGVRDEGRHGAGQPAPGARRRDGCSAARAAEPATRASTPPGQACSAGARWTPDYRAAARRSPGPASAARSARWRASAGGCDGVGIGRALLQPLALLRTEPVARKKVLDLCFQIAHDAAFLRGNPSSHSLSTGGLFPQGGIGWRRSDRESAHGATPSAADGMADHDRARRFRRVHADCCLSPPHRSPRREGRHHRGGPVERATSPPLRGRHA